MRRQLTSHQLSLHNRTMILLYFVLFGITDALRSSSLWLHLPQSVSSSLRFAKFSHHHQHHHQHQSRHRLYSSLDSSKVELQSDDTKFGRGDFHLSALINEGDVVAYQTGSWLVDGVVVGDGDDDAVSSYKLAKIDNLQVVWTHNCEHGVLRGIDVEIDPDDNTKVLVSEPLLDVEFGPEQLLARLPVTWEDEGSYVGVSNIPLEAKLWWSHDI